MTIPPSGTYSNTEEAIMESHRTERLPEIERIRETVPEHQKADVDRLWELVREAARG